MSARLQGKGSRKKREGMTANERQSESLKVMELKRPKQDRTGDYGTDAVGYHIEESVHQ